MKTHSLRPSIHEACLACLAACGLALSACGDSGAGPAPADIEASGILADVADKVILATYRDLDAKADSLTAAVVRFRASRTGADLDAARQAWKDARRPWEQSEAFLFGPVESRGIDPSIDSWPVNQADLDGVLKSAAELDKAYIDAQEGTLKGFHTMEYLLFGSGSPKAAAAFTDRELAYLAAVTQSFQGAVAELRAAWEPGQGAYVKALAGAGEGSAAYASQKGALQELVNGMIGICDEVATGKINDPFSQGDRGLEESRFSDNSNQDFADNIRSVENLYLGRYGTGSGEGISAFVARSKPEVDARLKAEIVAAIAAIGEMTPTFGEAITGNKDKVEAAQAAVLKVKATLEADVLPMVSG